MEEKSARMRTRNNDLKDREDGLAPLWGCVLIGGKSSRMGQPKHLMKHPSGLSWLEVTVRKLSPYVEKVLVAGKGDLPDSLNIDRIDDEAGLVGPLAGLVGAMRQYPGVSWLLTACDMPMITEDSIRWLIAERSRECSAVIPQLTEDKSRVEPLFACYECSCLSLLEDIAQKQSLRISDIRHYENVCQVVIPAKLQHSWTNLNTPDDVLKCKFEASEE